MSQMLYKAPGPHKLHGHDVDYIVVDEADIAATKKDGWHDTPADAQEAYLEAETAPKKNTQGARKENSK